MKAEGIQIAGSDIQAKVIAGIKRALEKTGEGQGLIEINKGTETKDPINGSVKVDDWKELNSVVTMFDTRLIDGTNILSGDVKLVSDPQVEINQGDPIRINGERYIVIEPGQVKPSDTVLAYQSQLRRQ